MKTIASCMTRTPHTISADLPLRTAIHTMGALGVRHLPVLVDGKLAGLLSDREIPYAADDATVGAAMNPGPYLTSANAPLRVVARDMAEHRFDAAVVLDEGHVVGIVTAVDLSRALADVLAEEEGSHLAPRCNRYGSVLS